MQQNNNIISTIQNILRNPSVMFAAGTALLYGHKGGTTLLVCLLFLAVVIAQIIATACLPDRQSAWARLCLRASVPMGVTAVLCLTMAIMAISAKPLAMLGTQDWLYCACAVLGMMANLMIARMLETGFSLHTLNWKTMWLVPTVWLLLLCTVAMMYNGGLSLLAWPLVAAAAWLGVFGHIGTLIRGADKAYLMMMVYNMWFGFSNVAGDHPNSLIVMSAMANGAAYYMVAVEARRMMKTQRIPADQLVYIEIPGVVYRAPRPQNDLPFLWEPLSFNPASSQPYRV